MAPRIARQKVRQGLECGNSVTEAIYEAGFNSSGRFYEKSTDMLGMPPSQYGARGAKQEINFPVGGTSLGSIFVALSQHAGAGTLLEAHPSLLAPHPHTHFPPT